MFVLSLPALQLVPLEALGIGGLNWYTVFLVIFVVATMSAAAPPVRSAVPGWITYFSILVALAALYTWLTVHTPLWPLLVLVKNWLFPFSLFFLGRRLVRQTGQLGSSSCSASPSSVLHWRCTVCTTDHDRQSPHRPAGRPAHGPGKSLRRIPRHAGAPVSVRLEDVRIGLDRTHLSRSRGVRDGADPRVHPVAGRLAGVWSRRHGCGVHDQSCRGRPAGCRRPGRRALGPRRSLVARRRDAHRRRRIGRQLARGNARRILRRCA